MASRSWYELALLDNSKTSLPKTNDCGSSIKHSFSGYLIPSKAAISITGEYRQESSHILPLIETLQRFPLNFIQTSDAVRQSVGLAVLEQPVGHILMSFSPDGVGFCIPSCNRQEDFRWRHRTTFVPRVETDSCRSVKLNRTLI